ncbi:hypothetical protein PYW08_000496 [Mythimna loreyi]|uniref:Uncharacterized protein n=1 Tax=Mythimna loreyi TaxID=667449 RepID=A0ACC2RCM2_9NEOP|nr:hypothetical protein PYW08_000496 [Mythimna loreyi]
MTNCHIISVGTEKDEEAVSNAKPTMWLLGGGAARTPPQRAVRGPAILATPDGAVPQVQCITHNYATAPRKRGLAEWVWTLTGQNRHNREKVDPGGELQIMLPAQPDKATSGEVCLLAESPFRILRVYQLQNCYIESLFQ